MGKPSGKSRGSGAADAERAARQQSCLHIRRRFDAARDGFLCPDCGAPVDMMGNPRPPAPPAAPRIPHAAGCVCVRCQDAMPAPQRFIKTPAGWELLPGSHVTLSGDLFGHHDPKVPGVAVEHPPLQMLLWCPECSERHVDVGAFATKPHHTHACQECGHVWRPAIVATVGVRFLPGFKDGGGA